MINNINNINNTFCTITQKIISEKNLSLLSQKILIYLSSQITKKDREEIAKYIKADNCYVFTIDLTKLSKFFTYSDYTFNKELEKSIYELHQIFVEIPQIEDKEDIMTGLISQTIIENNKLLIFINPMIMIEITNEKEEGKKYEKQRYNNQ